MRLILALSRRKPRGNPRSLSWPVDLGPPGTPGPRAHHPGGSDGSRPGRPIGSQRPV